MRWLRLCTSIGLASSPLASRGHLWGRWCMHYLTSYVAYHRMSALIGVSPYSLAGVHEGSILMGCMLPI